MLQPARAQSVGSKPSPLCLCAATLPVVGADRTDVRRSGRRGGEGWLPAGVNDGTTVNRRVHSEATRPPDELYYYLPLTYTRLVYVSTV
jgi:hypothetical protein